ncbi:response regulator transcription factor [Aquihabitans sp. G128]|uniref:response regulator transcription factor n=1 Tax=Aquihabitans sp. G128 TaxID=2849779 RepID=UPI001C218700|nr:response regulator transcription factor [Aquihabitans sp. G128]QXC61576.1 response regulator transcription factor [Aquihabitans sp. G128]
MARKILVVEDEALIADAVAARLRSEGYEVQLAADGPAGVGHARRWEPDLVILDLMLPGLDGLEVCRQIQKDRHLPVLMLTARDDETDLVIGLAVGADDYLTKPFSMRELVARVQALFRRIDALAGVTPARTLTLDDDIEIDVDARRVRQRGEIVHLTPTEFDLLVGLAEKPGRVLTREKLLADVWGYRDGSGARTVDSHVRALRRKLGDNVVRTVHGVGYGLGEGDPGDADGSELDGARPADPPGPDADG